jgi:hypothetical protein
MTTRMFNERNTATSSSRLAKFSSVTIAPSMLRTNAFSRNLGMYWSMPRKSVGFTSSLRFSYTSHSVFIVVHFGTYSVLAEMQTKFVSLMESLVRNAGFSLALRRSNSARDPAFPRQAKA